MKLLLLCILAGLAAAQERLVIVAPERFQDALAPFLAHKRADLPTRLVTLEKALHGPGADDPERLKRFLFDAWRRRGARYVLLVGDVDVFPVRYMVLDRKTAAAFDYAFYPSDLYYADLARRDGSFDDWNARKDGFHKRYFGEVRPPPNEKEVIGLFNSGVDLVLHAGHGTNTLWEKCLSVKSLARLTNTARLPVVFSAGCSTAYFAPLPPYDAYVDIVGKSTTARTPSRSSWRPRRPPGPISRTGPASASSSCSMATRARSRTSDATPAANRAA